MSELIAEKAPRAYGLLERYAENVPKLSVCAALLTPNGTDFCGIKDGTVVSESDVRSYEICSITKTFTGSLLAKLVYKNKLSLSDRVSKYINGIPGDAIDPTILQLATHTAGYGENLFDGNGPFSPLDIPDIASKNPYASFTQADVEGFVRSAKRKDAVCGACYSNLGIAVLALIIAKLEGKSPVQALKDFIENDLGIKGFSCGRPQENVVEGVDENGNGCGNWQWGESPFLCMGGLYAPADALIEYAKLQLSNTPKYLSLGHIPREEHFEKGNRTGLCWFITDNGIVWHNGGTGCFKTFFGFSTESKKAAVVLSNQKARNGVTPERIGFSMLTEK